jgi:hypothetical protein
MMENVMNALTLTGQGMFGIFFVMIIISLLVRVLGKMNFDKKDK